MGKLDDAKLSIDQNISSNGNEEITGGTLNAVLNEVVDATKGAITDTTLSFGQNILNLRNEVFPKLTQLSQEWQGVKDSIQDAVLEVEVAPHIEVVAVSGGAAILQPDKLYDFGEVANLAIGFEAPLEGKAANYAFQFKSPADAPTTITMPDSVVFPVESDSMFNVKAGRTYQVTILNNLASASSWEV